ncbi:MAG: hypothetical protein OEY85_11320, partial [Rhodospirillales bacterium]|nr:hypothetical protein [Rhodospirillales bacterium]
MPRFTGPFILTCILALILGAGTVWAGGPASVRSLLEDRRQNVILQQWDLSCAAAALATVLRYQHGEPAT